MKKSLLVLLAVVISTQAAAQTECYGDYPYRTCVTTNTDSRGNVTIRASGAGGSYTVRSESYTGPDGSLNARSSDSEGHSYAVKSWCDSGGCHSRDTNGHTCTITRTGQMIGCR